MGILDNLDLNDPKTMGLLSAGLQILANNGQMRPGQAIAGGLLGGLGDMRQVQHQQALRDIRQQQMDMQKEQFGWERNDRQAAEDLRSRQAAMYGDIANQYGLDPNVVTAFPDIAKDVVKDRVIPKKPKVAFTPGGEAYDDNNPITLQIGKNYAKPETNSTPSSIQEYQFARDQGFRGSFVDFQLAQRRAGASNTNVTYGAPVAGIDASGNPVFFQPDKGGGAPVIVPGVKPKPDKQAPITEAQGKANLFATRAAAADKIITGLEGKYSPMAVNAKGAAEGMFGIGGIAGPIANSLLGVEGQKAEQAQRDFINAVLRQESGAVIADSEFYNAKKQYFPQPGDSKETIQQKAENRRIAIDGLRTMSGPLGTDMPQRVKRYNPKTGRIE